MVLKKAPHSITITDLYTPKEEDRSKLNAIQQNPDFRNHLKEAIATHLQNPTNRYPADLATAPQIDDSTPIELSIQNKVDDIYVVNTVIHQKKYVAQIKKIAPHEIRIAYIEQTAPFSEELAAWTALSKKEAFLTGLRQEAQKYISSTFQVDAPRARYTFQIKGETPTTHPLGDNFQSIEKQANSFIPRDCAAYYALLVLLSQTGQAASAKLAVGIQSSDWQTHINNLDPELRDLTVIKNENTIELTSFLPILAIHTNSLATKYPLGRIRLVQTIDVTDTDNPQLSTKISFIPKTFF